MPIPPEDVVKGRIAETLVNELLRACGNKVYRFGYEIVLQNLTQLEQTFNLYTKTSEIIRSIPDFVVVNKEGTPFFVEVKFRAHRPRKPLFRNKEQAKIANIIDYWNAVLIVVTTKPPYFWTSDNSSSSKKYQLVPLQYSKHFRIDTNTLEKFNILVENYYLKTQSKN